MDYQDARRIRRTGLGSLIVKRAFEGEGFGAIGSSISDKFKAKGKGIQEALDPLNFVRKLTGKGFFGDLAVSGLGRAFGRSTADIEAFGGYGRKKKRNKNPQYATVSAGPIRPLKMGDSVADILGKMYNFMVKSEQVYKLNHEIEKSFRQEQLDEDDHRHKELVKAIAQFTKKRKSYKLAKKDDEEGGSLLDAILTGLKLWALELIASLKNFLGKIPRFGLPRGGNRGNQNVPGRGNQNRPGVPRTNKTPTQKTPAQRRTQPKARGGGTNRETRTSRNTRPPTEPPKSTFKKITTVGSKALKAAGDAARFLGSIDKLNIGLQVGFAALDIGEAEAEYKLGVIDEKQLQERVTEDLGAALGGVIGTELGVLLGTLGGPFAGVTVPLGGMVGGYLGNDAGRAIAKKMYKIFSDDPEEIPFNEKLNEKTFGKFEGGAAMGGAHIKNNLSPKATPEVKNITIPMSYNKSLGLNKDESVVAVSNKVNDIGGKPPKIQSTAPAKQRDTAIFRQLNNISVPV